MNESKLLKGNLQTIVLKLLQDNDKMYGYEMVQKVKEITAGQLQITEGALYPTLHKLEANGWLEIEWVKVDNRMRKYYRLTENGQKETANKLAELARYLETISLIFQPAKTELT